MLTEFMTVRSAVRPLAAVFGLCLLVAGCEKVSLVAPSGSSIILTAQATALPANGTTDLIAQVLEAAGTPPHSGTVITFTTTLGGVEPSEARTDISGRVIVKFRAGTNSGTATINATSGGATTIKSDGSGAVKIAVGTAAVARVSVSAAPNPVPAVGGTSMITANVSDINGNVLPSAPVIFTTTAGSLADSLVTTGADGSARTSLVTSVQATVTATVGVQGTGGATGGTGGTGNTSGTASGTVQVNVAGAPGLVITPPATPPSVGLPANFTFVVTAAATNPSTIRNLRVSWGDGETRDLGAVTGTSVQSHVYDNPGTYTVVGTVTDAIGNSTTVSASVTVIPVASPTIIITPSVPTNSTPVVTVTFQIQVTPPTGVIITNAVLNFGDGQSQTLGGLTGSTVVTHQYTLKGPLTVTLTVTDSIGRNTTGQATINVP